VWWEDEALPKLLGQKMQAPVPTVLEAQQRTRKQKKQPRKPAVNFALPLKKDNGKIGRGNHNRGKTRSSFTGDILVSPSGNVGGEGTRIRERTKNIFVMESRPRHKDIHRRKSAGQGEESEADPRKRYGGKRPG